MTKSLNLTIQKLVESRIELGCRYMEQSLPVMHLNEDFNSNILTSLYKVKDNQQVFEIIKNKVPAIWTDIVDDMIDVYNTENFYSIVKNTFSDAKALGGDGDTHFPLMIYTDVNNSIKCVIAGNQVAHDTIYISRDSEDLLQERFDALTEVKKRLEDKNIIGHLPGGNSKKTKEKLDKSMVLADPWVKVSLQVAIGKLFFDIAAKYNDTLGKANADKVKDEISIWGDPEKVFQELSMRASTHKNTKPITFTSGGEEKRKASTKNTRSSDVAKGSNTTPEYEFSLAIRMYPSKYDFENMIKPEILRDILRLANIRTEPFTGNEELDDMTVEDIEKNVPMYSDNDIKEADDDELYEMYDNMRTLNVRNSLLYSFGNLKDTTHGRYFSAFNQLALIPDKIAYLYSIANIPTTRNNRLSDIGNLDDEIYTSGTPGDIEDRYREMMSPEARLHRQHNFEVGVQPRSSSNKYYNRRLIAQASDTNIHGNAGRNAEELRLLRKQRRAGMIRTSREIRDDEARNRRGDWLSSESELDREGKPKFNAQVYKNRYQKDIAGPNVPTQIDASTGKPIPRNETMLRGYYNDFMASYDSFRDTSESVYNKLIIKIDKFADSTKDYQFANTFKKILLNYFTIFDTAVESAYDYISTTGGNADLYKSFCGMLATGTEEPGYFLKYGGKDGIVSAINKSINASNKYPKESLQVVKSNMENDITELNEVIDKLCEDQKHKEYLMLTARRRYRK